MRAFAAYVADGRSISFQPVLPILQRSGFTFSRMRYRLSGRTRKGRGPRKEKRDVVSAKLSLFPRIPVSIAVAAGLTAIAAGYFTLRYPELASGAFRRNPFTSPQKDAIGHQHSNSGMAPVFKAEVIAAYKHDPKAFTQGLVWRNGYLYESTGLYGHSSVRKVESKTGEVLQVHNLSNSDFGEGLAITSDGSKLLQVLWKVGKGYIFDAETIERVSEFSFAGDAWGLACSEGTENDLFMSDGSSTVKVLQVQNGNASVVREITVHDGDREVGLLNELEIVNGELWANIWMSDFIARVDPSTGVVKSWIDLRDVLRKEAVPTGHDVDVLNGIAYNSATESVYVTGKLWPELYEIKPTPERVADNVTTVTNAFFLNKEQVEYVHNNVLM